MAETKDKAVAMSTADGSGVLAERVGLARGRVFLTGIQALVRLPLLQRQRDAAAGLNTAGFISGYRGSPLGGLDQTLWKAKAQLQAEHIVFQPGVNEDLAATAVWGSQQLDVFPGSRFDGVFGLWYGKGPGVDRCGDVFKHANMAGTARHGGVLAVAGDDHAARSSSVAHQSEHAFKAALMPVLVPTSVQDYLDLGLHGWAMSRYSGCWVGFKAVADTVESAATVEVDPERVQILLPEDFHLPADPLGLNIRWPDERTGQEQRLLHHKLYAALAYCRANRLNRVVIDSPTPRLGIITCGKSYQDVRQAFADLGIDDRLAAEIGIRLYLVGMVWPLESEGVRHFAEGLEEILVIEEKRQLLEYQLKEELYNWREDVRPRVIGKFDEKGEWALPHGDWLLPAAGELTPALIARVIAERIGRFFTSPRIRERLAQIEARERAVALPVIPIARMPHYCPGCPHNTSTKVPEGSRAVAGIGCHFMVTWMNRRTDTFSQMGGEGVAWLGQAPFTEEKHIFSNLGDGTYYHSGVLAIRAAIAAKVNITYKLLYNDAVAMTGGQPVDGPLTVPMLAAQLRAEGVQELVVVVDDEPRAWQESELPEGVEVRHRRELDAIQREFRELPGVSVILYDQTCAAEKRRRRKRGKLVDPPRHAFINEHVCEGCGDCGVASNCLAVVPVETEFGRKRGIDQSACNKDFSCVEGFCPAFVTVEGGQRRRGVALAAADDWPALPEPVLPSTARPYNVLVTGVGGTGIITLGALLGTAAHVDGKGVSTLDMTGLAQKGGAVFSHVRICDDAAQLHAVRLATAEADAVVGGDIVVTASNEALVKMLAGRTRVLVNSVETPTAEFTRNPDWQFPLGRMLRALTDAVGEGAVDAFDASHLTERLLGNATYTNTFLLGFAWQRGLLPVSLAALETAIRQNGTAVEANLQALRWGRRTAHDRAAVERFAGLRQEATAPTLAERQQQRETFLTAYQDATYAARYRRWVAEVMAVEQRAFGADATELGEAVMRYAFKLMAIKDEYEVARLYVDSDFSQRVAAAFEGDYRIHFHFAPPLFSKPDPVTGKPRKWQLGPWLRPLLGGLARLRRLRGSVWDVFGYTAERRMERQLLADYADDVALILRALAALPAGAATPGWWPDALALARLPEDIRGFGHVKEANVAKVAARRLALRQTLLAVVEMGADEREAVTGLT